jgi:hypothetical protein
MSITLSKESLYERAKALFNEIVTLEQDLDALGEEYTYAKNENELGIEKAIVKSTLKAAEVYVRNNIDKEEDKIAKAKDFVEFYKEISGEYN